MTTTFRTTEAYISGGICGSLWWPASPAGKTVRKNLRGPFGIMDRFTEPATFADALSTLLCEEGGDFQHARFTADSRLTIVRRRTVGPGRSELHVFERELSALPGCADYVDPETFTGDFIDVDEREEE